ncbi:MAG: nucleotide exchange factor GrpE [Acidobacteria bacterium]|nr:nucleotide exchange factor GrpE [Acidobacteriota bacterium]
MTPDKKEQKANRIPVRFMDEENPAADEPERGSVESEPDADELGRASSYEDETEMQRRIDRGGQEEDAQADDSDVAGGPPPSDTPEQREDTDETPTQAAAPAIDEIEADTDEQSGKANSGPLSGPLMAELIATRAELKRVEAERSDLLDKLARRQADFENYRKRTERERGETYQRIVADVASKLLPVMDNMRRALEAEALLEKNESEEFGHFLHGVELIYKQLNTLLEELGVQPVAAVGQPFDPHVHEAVVTEQSDEHEPDTVIQELLRGYRLGEKLLRPAMVKVSTR